MAQLALGAVLMGEETLVFEDLSILWKWCLRLGGLVERRTVAQIRRHERLVAVDV